MSILRIHGNRRIESAKTPDFITVPSTITSLLVQKKYAASGGFFV